jgi:hypothetical protein
MPIAVAVTPDTGLGEEPPMGGSSCSLASATASTAYLPVHLIIPAFILIARLGRRRIN